MSAVRRLLECSIQDARSQIFDLSPPVLYELGFPAALEWLAERIQEQFRIPVEFESRLSSPELKNDQQVILFQLVRELLINVGKHSRASQAKIIIAREGPFLKIQVNDDGVGFDSSQIFAPRGEEQRLWLFQHARTLELSRRRAEGQIKARPGYADHYDDSAAGRQYGIRQGEFMSVKILIADDHKIMRDGLRHLLANEAGMEVVAEAKDGHETIQMAEQLRPDIIIMDISMDGLNGMDATRHIVAKNLGCRIIALSMHADKRFVAGMFEAGAMGYLLKDCAYDELVKAIQHVLSGRTYLCSMISGVLIRDYVRRRAKQARVALQPA